MLRDQQLTLAGLLFFGKNPQAIKPAFTIKAVSFVGNHIEGTQYRSKPHDLTGSIPELFKKAMSFLNIEFFNDIDGRQFTVTIPRPKRTLASDIRTYPSDMLVLGEENA